MILRKRAGLSPARLLARMLLIALTGALMAASSAAASESSAAWWKVGAKVTPSHLAPGQEGTISITATNLGDAAVQASPTNPVTIVDKLPPGVTVGSAEQCKEDTLPVCGLKWPVAHSVVEQPPCTVVSASEVRCTFTEELVPYEQWEVKLSVHAGAEVPSGTQLENEVQVEGGGIPAPAPLRRALEVSAEPTPFGIESYELAAENEEGGADDQAGSHPFEFTTSFAMNSEPHVFPDGRTLLSTPAPLRNLHVNLPAGLIGNASKSVVPQCTELQFTTVLSNNVANECEADTAVGVSVVRITEPSLGINLTIPEPVYNLVPAEGEPARFGFLALGIPVTLDTVVDEGDYHIVVNANNVSQAPVLLESSVTIWGVPGDPRHDASRGSQCVARSADALPGEECKPPAARNTSPFLTLPTSCSGPLATSASAQSWLYGAAALAPVSPLQTQALEGCSALPFNPAITVTPTEHRANTPTGLKVLLTVPQTTTLEEKGLAESTVRNTTVTLPEGVQLSPSAANGLQACSLAQMGWTGVNPASGTDEFNSTPASCPDASKVGTVRIKSPDLEDELKGSVYLAAQNENPFGSLFGIYIVVEDKKTGVLVKLAGKVSLDETTGQITSVFPNAPQLPFQELELELFSGPRATVTTPSSCGGFTTSASFDPWSGTPTLSASLDPGEFDISSGPEGAACASPLPLTPGFQAGATNSQAGAFTPFTLSLSRPDSSQALSGLSVTLPPGLAGVLADVKQCGEPQAAEGTCGAESLIGNATAVAGLGEDPYTETGGRVYITGPYDGAPFGLSIVIPAAAGPFDFGYVVTRASISVNPSTAALTIASTLPTMLNTTTYHTGVPVQLRRVDVTIERPGGAPFQFNPTNCSPMQITGTVSGEQGATSSVSTLFQVQNCQALPFAPKLTASAAGKASKANGASLDVKVVSPGLGQTNIAKVDLQLPEAMPSRLSTIQKACLAAVFEANPAACDEGSLIGKATIHTPILTSALTGPAYLVSHGGAAFPDVEFVLQGEGVTLILDGKTDIKKGITYSRFESTPDAPFTSFETELPAGPHSALTGYVKGTEQFNLCKANLAMPTEITAQNGAKIKQVTSIAATGCGGVLASKVSRATLLARALKACKKKKNKAKRLLCEKQAHRKYGPKKAKKKTKKKK